VVRPVMGEMRQELWGNVNVDAPQMVATPTPKAKRWLLGKHVGGNIDYDLEMKSKAIQGAKEAGRKPWDVARRMNQARIENAPLREQIIKEAETAGPGHTGVKGAKGVYRRNFGNPNSVLGPGLNLVSLGVNLALKKRGRANSIDETIGAADAALAATRARRARRSAIRVERGPKA